MDDKLTNMGPKLYVRAPQDTSKCLALWVKISADDILKYFYYLSQKTSFDMSCKLSPMETICMKCQILFCRKNKKTVINSSSAEFAESDKG